MTKMRLTLVGILSLSALLSTALVSAAAIRIRAADGTEYCLDPKGDSAKGSVVVLKPCSNLLEQDQQWSLHNGVIESEVNTNTCLDVTGAYASSGTSVQIYNCNGTVAQKWTYANGALRSFSGSDLCLDVPGASFYDGAQVQIWECNGTNAQNWRIK